VHPSDTIAAIATPPGRGGIGIIRISGPQTQTITQAILGFIPQPRYATHTAFLDQNDIIIDDGVALFFPNPNSFTGEDVLELQGHGGPIIQDCLLRRVLQLGARLARPGEFSERAFLNDKIDLAQAEAIADLIDAASEQAARAAMRSLQGEFSKRIQHLVEQLIHLRIYVEAAIDFPEEEIDFLSDGKVGAALKNILQDLRSVLITAQQGSLLREGMTVVIAGKPNAGKSSLLNALSERDAAIVADIPGTTRDVLREMVQIDGLPLHIIDTAGLRESSDQVEQEGVRRALAEIKKADRVLLIVDDQTKTPLGNLLVSDFERPDSLTVIRNKIDLTGEEPRLYQEDNITVIMLSAKTGAGLALLREHLKTCMGFDSHLEGNFIARRRHLDALQRAEQCLLNGEQQLTTHRAGELLAEDLRAAQHALGEITGEFTPDDLLGKIFANFCIGK
jgi:tRNA modification GTPase